MQGDGLIARYSSCDIGRVYDPKNHYHPHVLRLSTLQDIVTLCIICDDCDFSRKQRAKVEISEN